MKLSTLVCAAVLAVAPAAHAQNPAAAPVAPTPYAFPRSVQFDMPSKIAGHTYRIFVHTPPLPPPPGGYPVLYVTDGNGTFPVAAGQAELEALAGGHMLVVGIGYTTDNVLLLQSLRNRDLTPSPPSKPVAGLSAKPEDFGGAELFYRFITEELRPAIAAANKVDPKDQTLYGHSLGGLFTLGVLFHHPDAFRGFVASSPSIWWNDREVLKGEADFRKAVEARQVAPRILIEVGGREQTPPAQLPTGMTPAQAKALVESSRMVGNAVDLAARLSQLKGGPGYEVRSQVFEKEDHISTMAAGMSRALTFAENR
ncbi:MAG: alpha/beta hydrolase [Proteobacteria bacterium]|nr:alpha/beta hydrolase [Pseudomonadota bacterium]